MKDFWGEEEEKPKKLHIKKIIVVSILVILLVLFIVFDHLYNSNREIRNWFDINIFRKQITKNDIVSIDIGEEQNVNVMVYGKNIAILRKKKLELYDNWGSKKTEIDVDINNPIYNEENNYLGIAENKGKKVYLVNDRKVLWENEIEGEISQIEVNKNGYTAIVVTNTSYKSIIYMYDINGNELFKTFLAKGRVVDLSISDNGDNLAIAEIDTTGVLIQSKVRIVSVKKIKGNQESDFTYIYNADVNRMISNIEYQGSSKIVCVYDDAIDILEGENSKKIYEFNDKDVINFSNELSDNIVIVEERNVNSNITIKNILNMKIKEYLVNKVIKDIVTYKNIIALNFGTELHIINTNGWLIKKYLSEQEINNILVSKNIVCIVEREKIYIINL